MNRQDGGGRRKVAPFAGWIGKPRESESPFPPPYKRDASLLERVGNATGGKGGKSSLSNAGEKKEVRLCVNSAGAKRGKSAHISPRGRERRFSVCRVGGEGGKKGTMLSTGREKKSPSVTPSAVKEG